jgi:hypothetical protein
MLSLDQLLYFPRPVAIVGAANVSFAPIVRATYAYSRLLASLIYHAVEANQELPPAGVTEQKNDDPVAGRRKYSLARHSGTVPAV